MKFMKILLREGRKEDLKKKYSDKFDEKTLDWILNISDLVDFNHKYTDFVLRTIDPETQDVEWWTEMTIDELKLFDKYQNQLEKKDINQYENFYQLQSAIGPVQQREKEKELEKQVDKVYEDDRVLVIKPKTKQSSCKYGKGTKWCTAATGDNRFEQYSSGNQALYYIILKGLEKQLGYKIAVHFANSGKMSLWDDEDHMLSDRETALIMTQNRELFNTILEDYQQSRVKGFDKVVTDAFDIVKDNYGNVGRRNDTFSPLRVYVVLSGMNLLPDMGNHADATIGIRWTYDRYTMDNSELIDEYTVFIAYKVENDILFLDFSLGDEKDPPIRDLGLGGIEMRGVIGYESEHSKLRMKISELIIDNVYKRLLPPNTELSDFLQDRTKNDPQTWYYDRFSGYKFTENKGMIKSLVDWLDSGKTGSKLEFLTDIGKLKRKIVNNRAVYARKDSDEYFPSSRWRGQLASFFSTAKRAGIINYRKVSNQFYISKGPNFESFKEGKLKAI